MPSNRPINYRSPPAARPTCRPCSVNLTIQFIKPKALLNFPQVQNCWPKFLLTRLSLILAFIVSVLVPSVKATADTNGAFDAVVRINREVGGHCTGFAVDANTVITAAHCLWLERPRNWIRPSSLHVLAGYDRGRYSQHLQVVAYRIADAYQPGGGDPGQDWALLSLDRRFNGTPLPLADKMPRKGSTYMVAGFASTRHHRLTQQVGCRVLRRSNSAFEHACPTAKGVSGAPVIGWQGNARAAYGLHIASSRVSGIAVLAPTIRAGMSTARQPYR